MEDKKNIGFLFDRIAGRYDFLNHLLSLNIDRYWRRKAVRTVGSKDSIRSCLDVAIGTADLAIELARQMPQLNVQGIDLSSQMMQIGAEKVKNLGLQKRIAFMQGSALELPFDDNSFDLVTCAYGVRNFSDLDKGLSEMLRVLKHGSQVMILEFSYPSNPFIAWVYDLYFSHILPFVGRIVSHDKNAYSYLNRSVKGFVWGERMCQKLLNAGFHDARYQTLSLGITTIYTAVK